MDNAPLMILPRHAISEEMLGVADAAVRIYQEGTAENTVIAWKKDLRYFREWHQLRFPEESNDCPYSEKALIAFITDHIDNTLPPEIDLLLVASGVKAQLGNHKLSTVRRKISSLSSEHQRQNAKPNPCTATAVLLLLAKAEKQAVKRADMSGISAVQRKKALTKNPLMALLETCKDSLIDQRDRALLLVAFASGGRRRSEVVNLRVEDLVRHPSGDYTIQIRFSKTDQTGKGVVKPIRGHAAQALEQWLGVSGIQSGMLFRSIHKGGAVQQRLSAKSVNLIVKKRAQLAGLSDTEVRALGAHSLRSGFATECGLQKVPLADAMNLTGHKTFSVFNQYYQQGDVLHNPASNLI